VRADGYYNPPSRSASAREVEASHELASQLADALENVLAATPELANYDDTVAEAERVLERARRNLS
jgi:ribosomal 50S subunit-associated protein YjgA (DUF615 family)